MLWGIAALFGQAKRNPIKRGISYLSLVWILSPRTFACGAPFQRLRLEEGLSQATSTAHEYREGDPGSSSSDVVTSIAGDRDKLLWLATAGCGVNALLPRALARDFGYRRIQTLARDARGASDG